MKKRTTALLIVLLTMSLCACDFFGKKEEAPTVPDTDHTITFEANGAEEGIAPINVPNGETATIPIPTKDGCVFAGWYLDAELTNRYFFDYPLTEDTTLYAKFYDTTLGEYIVISNVDQLNAIKEAPDAKYLLACDINCHGDTLVPIDEFTGELDGNGYKILNFSLTEDADSVGFFRTNNGTIKNLSFGNFIYDVTLSFVGEQNYGVICAVNNGTIDNCAVLDSAMRVSSHCKSNSSNIYIGGITGTNYGVLKNCRNGASQDVYTTTYVYYGGFANGKQYGSRINTGMGGIAGRNAAEGIIDSAESSGRQYAKGTATDLSKNNFYIGGAVGHNLGSFKNGSAAGEIVLENIDDSESMNYVGGFVGRNCGMLYGCHSTVSISDIGDNAYAVNYAIGGFVGENYHQDGHNALINKCFSTGSITVKGDADNVGYFAGISSAASKDCYYIDTMTVTKIVVADEVGAAESVSMTLTNNVGEAKTESQLLSFDFQANTLLLDRMVWFLVDGKLPELR